MKKVCSTCKKRKSLIEFYKRTASRDGREASCKCCKSDQPANKKGTIQYFKYRSWNNINKRTINGAYPYLDNVKLKKYFEKGIRLEMTRDEFYNFCDKNKNKILSMYKRGETPSVDRKNPNKHYERGNLQIVTLSENSIRANEGRKK